MRHVDHDLGSKLQKNDTFQTTVPLIKWKFYFPYGSLIKYCFAPFLVSPQIGIILPSNCSALVQSPVMLLKSPLTPPENFLQANFKKCYFVSGGWVSEYDYLGESVGCQIELRPSTESPILMISADLPGSEVR